MDRKALIKIIVGITLMFTFLIVAFLVSNSSSTEEVDYKMWKFYEEECSGELDFVTLNSAESSFTLFDGSKHSFIWDTSKYPDDYFETELPQNVDLADMGGEGDSIIKLSNKNYFILKKKSGLMLIYFIKVPNKSSIK